MRFNRLNKGPNIFNVIIIIFNFYINFKIENKKGYKKIRLMYWKLIKKGTKVKSSLYDENKIS
jgi:hypothetical protein